MITHPELVDLETDGELAFRSHFEWPRRQQIMGELLHREIEVQEALKVELISLINNIVAESGLNPGEVDDFELWSEENAEALELSLGKDRLSRILKDSKDLVAKVEESMARVEWIKGENEGYHLYVHQLVKRQHLLVGKLLNHRWCSLSVHIIFGLGMIFRKHRQPKAQKLSKNAINKLRRNSINGSSPLKSPTKPSDEISNDVKPKSKPTNLKKSWMDFFTFKSTARPHVGSTIVPSPDEGPTCCVCLDSPPQVVLVPCGHMNICDPCAREWKKKRNVGEGKECGGGCPTCRRNIKRIQPFIPL